MIGSHVVEQLLGMGHDVVVFDDLSGGIKENITQGAKFVQGSILDAPLLDWLFEKHHFDYVYHFAAYAAEGLSHFIKRFNYLNNVVGSVNLINASVNHSVKHFVFASSIAVYGRAQMPATEETLPIPEDSYGIAKLAVEQELRVTHEMFGLDYTIFRLHNVYGERQNLADPYRNVIAIFMNQIMRGDPMTIFGDGTQQRAFTFVDDVAGVLASAPFQDGTLNETVNLGTDETHSINALAAMVAHAMGVERRVVHLDPRNEVSVAFANHKKARSIFGERQTELAVGLLRMAEYVKLLGPRIGRWRGDIEIAKNLPPSWAERDMLAVKE